MRRIAMGCVVMVACCVGANCDSASDTATTTPTNTPSVTDIRALVKGAIAMKDDPGQAQAMMVRACEWTAKLPPGSDYKALMVEFNPDREKLDHLMKPSATKVVEEKKKLSAHVELSEKYLSSTHPFTAMADNGKGVIFPKPITSKVLQEQNLQRDGKTVYSIVDDPRKDTRWKTYFVSPDEKYVVLQDWLHAKSTEVLSADTGTTVAVEVPEIKGHNNVDPFSFFKWDSDSQSFTVEATGSYIKGPGQFLAYRELWQVQANSGKARRIKRQEQPWNEKLKWED